MPTSRWSRLELFVCDCVLAGVVLSAQAGQGAVDMYGWRENGGWCVRAVSVSMSVQNERSARCGSSGGWKRGESEVLRDTGRQGVRRGWLEYPGVF